MKKIDTRPGTLFNIERNKNTPRLAGIRVKTDESIEDIIKILEILKKRFEDV